MFQHCRIKLSIITVAFLTIILSILPTPRAAAQKLGMKAAAPAAVATGPTDEDYRKHIEALHKKLPHDGFTILIEKPFVVIGDEPEKTVRERAQYTVRWAVTQLKKDYFPNDPTEILDIWLFQNATSYYKNAEKIFGDRPTTPYGYFSDVDRALVMNIATGGGTLVHEIVHPFMAANFPYCPPWLNEGLGSLYEQSSSRDGKIVGLTNWRLAGLQKTIREGKLPPFKTLCQADTLKFYNKDPGSNYAQARYLCYYLQQRNLLRTYYHAARAAYRTDPSGYETLKKTLGMKSESEMATFQKRWEAWILKLRFP